MAQHGVAILGRVVLGVQLGSVRALTSFAVASGVGFDAILGVDFLYEHGISVNLAQHWLVFEEHDGLVVPLVGRHPRFKHACAMTPDASLCPGTRAVVQCTCARPKGMVRALGAPEVYLVAARKDSRLGLVIREQLSTGMIEIQSAADHPLYLPTGWAVAKVLDCQFVPYGAPRLFPRSQRVVISLLTAGETGKSSQALYDYHIESAAGNEGPAPKGPEGSHQEEEDD